MDRFIEKIKENQTIYLEKEEEEINRMNTIFVFAICGFNFYAN